MKHKVLITMVLILATFAVGCGVAAWFIGADGGVERGLVWTALVTLALAPYAVLVALAWFCRRWRLLRGAALGGLIALVPIAAWGYYDALTTGYCVPMEFLVLVMLWAAAIATVILGVLFEVLLGRFARRRPSAGAEPQNR